MRGPALAAVLLTLAASPASAQTWVRVRAECRIELRTERSPGEVRVVGTLRDDLGAPLADRLVLVTVSTEDPMSSPVRLRTRTDAAGRFSAPLELDPSDAPRRLEALFEGDDDYEHSHVERALDLSRAEVSLRVGVPDGGRLRLDRPSHPVRVEASSDEGSAGLSIELTDELSRVLGRGTTDARGVLELVVSTADLGPPAAGRLIARSLADARRAEAQTEVPIVRVGPTTVTLRSTASSARAGEPVHVSGGLHDHHGVGITRAAVGIYRAGAAGAPLATVLTGGRDGAFDATVVMPPGESGLTLVARFESDAPWRASSESAPARVLRATAGGAPWPWLALMCALTAVVVALLARRAGRSGARETERAPVLRPPGIDLAGRRGIRPERLDIGGVVLDARDEAPVAGARVTLTREGEGAETLVTGPDGRFQLPRLAAGSWTIVIEAPAYTAMDATIALPHRGEWSSLRVRLASLRGRALDAVLAVAGEILPARAAITATPREVAARLEGRSRAAAPAGALADTVERAAFGAEPPTEPVVREAEVARDEALTALRTERGGAAPVRVEPPPRGGAIDR